MIYLDHAATTAVHPAVIEYMKPFLGELYGNPSSIYDFGKTANEMIEETRKLIAASLGAAPEEIYFTSGGTEGDNWAIIGMAECMAKKGKHIITSAIEHHAVLRSCAYLEKRGFEVTYLPVDEEGRVELEALERAIRPDTILISIMYANNEIGTIQPVGEISEIAKRAGVAFHTDAVQAYMHENVRVEEGIDLLCASAHKFQGPKGVGFLYAKKSLPLSSYLHGGSQERGMRAGTENVAGIIGMGKAVSLGLEGREKEQKKMTSLKTYVLEEMKRRIPDIRVNGSLNHRLAGNIHVSFRGVEGESLLLLLDLEGICVSGGSACASSEAGISHVIQAIRVPEEYARGSLRITLGGENTREELEFFLRRLESIVAELRAL